MQEYIISSEELRFFQDIDRFYALCEQCENFGRNHACPPIDFLASLPFDAYKTAHVFISEVEDASERKAMQIKADKELTARFDSVFSSGYCQKCAVCNRKNGGVCEKFLYSTEVLCIDMFALYTHLTAKKMRFDGKTLMHIAFSN